MVTATGNIQLINNSDKGSGNTLLSSSQSYREKIKSPQYLSCIEPQYQKERKSGVFGYEYIIQASNEQPSLKPLEKRLLNDFGFQKFIVCTDAGLGSEANRRFNDIGDRGFIVTQSLKKLKESEQSTAMDDKNWHRLSDGKPVKNFREIRMNPAAHTDEIFYKERVHDGSSVIGQLMIVTYSCLL